MFANFRNVSIESKITAFLPHAFGSSYPTIRVVVVGLRRTKSNYTAYNRPYLLLLHRTMIRMMLILQNVANIRL